MVFADYHQIHVRDSRSTSDPGAKWDARTLRQRVALAGDAAALATARDTEVPLHLVAAAGAPAAPDAADHVVEFDLAAVSGLLVVGGPTEYAGGALALEVPPGLLRVRAEFSGLSTVSEDGLSGRDSYQVTVWPAAEREPLEVVRQFESTVG